MPKNQNFERKLKKRNNAVHTKHWHNQSSKQSSYGFSKYFDFYNSNLVIVTDTYSLISMTPFFYLICGDCVLLSIMKNKKTQKITNLFLFSKSISFVKSQLNNMFLFCHFRTI